MQEKKDLILRTALTLFAQKGHHSTSMQEIAEASGVAKGTLYTYFQSKDDLLFTIFKTYYQYFSDKIQSIEKRSDLSEKEKFYKQIYTLLSEMMDLREFIIVYFREQFLPNESNFQQFYMQSFQESFTWLREKMVKVYGEKVRSHASDLAIFFKAVVQHFFFYPLCLSRSVTVKDVCDFAFHRLEDAIDGSILQEKPLTTDSLHFHTIDHIFTKSENKIYTLVQKLKVKLFKTNVSPEKRDVLFQTVDAIFHEWKKIDPDTIILSGLFLYLKQQCPDSIKKEVEALEQFVRSNM
ncbi:TetR/AcrR family transcriptional regulator [Fervidibacillus halotolerans]|uniref:TetR family transcriptional regulator n=1 Tax=Fervidibacillus halotolerans TaxID=2980027 RepID=A0A9E8M0Y8_9BACI|nr:TetR/AcrR family transcriptional regulator [Fervidibacillus halotolerans]WAA13204.1 TetR family transcriptional regulator [Fervidibacillus halotolerans]